MYTLSGAALQTHNNNNAVVFAFFGRFLLLAIRFDVLDEKKLHTISIGDSAVLLVLWLALFFFSVQFRVFVLIFIVWFGVYGSLAHTSISIHIICLFICFFLFTNSVVAFEWAFASFFRFCGPL